MENGAEWVTTLLFLFLDSGAVNYDYDVLDELITKRYDNEEEAEAQLQV